MLFSFKEGSELLRLRHAMRLEGYLAALLKNATQGLSELSMIDINKRVDALGRKSCVTAVETVVANNVS
jgi:hypothetical protein